MREKSPLEGCAKEQKQLEEFLQAYRSVFQEPRWIPPKREVQHEIQLLPYFMFPNIRCYR